MVIGLLRDAFAALSLPGSLCTKNGCNMSTYVTMAVTSNFHPLLPSAEDNRHYMHTANLHSFAIAVALAFALRGPSAKCCIGCRWPWRYYSTLNHYTPKPSLLFCAWVRAIGITCFMLTDISDQIDSALLTTSRVAAALGTLCVTLDLEEDNVELIVNCGRSTVGWSCDVPRCMVYCAMCCSVLCIESDTREGLGTVFLAGESCLEARRVSQS